MATRRIARVTTPRQKLRWVMEDTEGRFIQLGEMSRTLAEKQNKYLKKNGSVYRWVTSTAYLNEIFIARPFAS